MHEKYESIQESIREQGLKANSVRGSSMQGVFLDWVAKESHFKEAVFELRLESLASHTGTWRDSLPSNGFSDPNKNHSGRPSSNHTALDTLFLLSWFSEWKWK